MGFKYFLNSSIFSCNGQMTSTTTFLALDTRETFSARCRQRVDQLSNKVKVIMCDGGLIHPPLQSKPNMNSESGKNASEGWRCSFEEKSTKARVRRSGREAEVGSGTQWPRRKPKKRFIENEKRQRKLVTHKKKVCDQITIHNEKRTFCALQFPSYFGQSTLPALIPLLKSVEQPLTQNTLTHMLTVCVVLIYRDSWLWFYSSWTRSVPRTDPELLSSLLPHDGAVRSVYRSPYGSGQKKT